MIQLTKLCRSEKLAILVKIAKQTRSTIIEKTVTFSFNTKYIDSRIVETFTFENLGIDEDMDDETEKK